MHKKLIVLALVLCSVFAYSITLDTAIELAKKNNKELQIAKAEIGVADAKYHDVKGSLLPQITAGGNIYAKRTELPDSAIPNMQSLSKALDDSSEATNDNQKLIGGFVDGMAANMVPDDITEEGGVAGQVKLSQVIFMGGKLINGISVARKVKTIEEKNYKLKEKDIVYETQDMFYKALLAKKAVEIHTQAFEIVQNHYQRVTNLYAQGLVSEYDKLRAELEVSKQKPALLEAKNNFKLATQALKKQIGMFDEEITLEGEIVLEKVSTTSLNDGINQGLTNRLELDLSSISVDIYDLQLTVEKSNWMPNIALTAAYNVYTKADEYKVEGDDFGNMAEVGIGFEMPIFTGLSNTAKRQKAKYQLRQAKYKNADLEEMIKLQITNSYLNLKHRLDELKSLQKNLQLAEKGLEIAKARYDNSIGIQLEVFDAQLQQKTAKLKLLESKYKTIMANKAYEKSLGL